MIRTSTRLPMVLVFTLAGLLGSALAADNPNAKKSDPKPADAPGAVNPADLKKVVHELIDEARQSLHQTQTWPRKESDYAVITNTSMPSDQVIKALGQRWDRNGAIDGYVKWQLLSYQPNFADAKPQDLETIIRNMPELIPRQAPTPQQVRIFDAASKQPIPKYQDKLRETVHAYEAAVKQIDDVNAPSLAFRDHLDSTMPDKGGLRLLALLVDAEARFKAGNETCKDVNDLAIRLASQLKSDPDAMPPAMRRKLVSYMQSLILVNNPMIRNVSLTAEGKIIIKTFGRFEQTCRRARSIIETLNAHEPPQ